MLCCRSHHMYRAVLSIFISFSFVSISFSPNSYLYMSSLHQRNPSLLRTCVTSSRCRAHNSGQFRQLLPSRHWLELTHANSPKKVHGEAADCDSDAAASAKKKKNKINIFVCTAGHKPSCSPPPPLCVRHACLVATHMRPPPPPTPSSSLSPLLSLCCLQVDRAALVQKDTMRWQLRLADQAEPEQEERLPPRGCFRRMGSGEGGWGDSIYLPTCRVVGVLPSFCRIQLTGCCWSLLSGSVNCVRERGYTG